MCNWTAQSESFGRSAIFPWVKKTGAQLREGQILGPETDHNYDNSRNFIFPVIVTCQTLFLIHNA
jgi:hypothetical protein